MVENNCVNQRAINELVAHSKNVTAYEERAIELCELIVEMINEGEENKNDEFELWRNEGILLHAEYILNFEFGIKYLMNDFTEATYDKLAQDLAEAYREEIEKRIRKE